MEKSSINMSPEMDKPICTIPLFRRGASYVSYDKHPLGMELDPPVNICMAPWILLKQDVSWIHTTLSQLPPLPSPKAQRRIITNALISFSSGIVEVPGIGPQSPEDFFDLMNNVAGLPAKLVNQWLELLPTAYEQEAQSIVYEGGINLVSLPKNTFLCLTTVLTGLLSSDIVWIRPSRSEPFAAARLLGALIEAGWPAERLGFYPTSHDSLSRAVNWIDRATLFGNYTPQEITDAPTHIQMKGAGRTRVLVGKNVDTEQAASWLSHAIAGNGGRFCTNVGTILCEGDIEPLASSLAKRLDDIDLSESSPFPQSHPSLVFNPPSLDQWIQSQMQRGDRKYTMRSLEIAGKFAPCLIALANTQDHPLIGAELPLSFASITSASETQFASLCHDAAFIYLLGMEAPIELQYSAPIAEVIPISLPSID